MSQKTLCFVATLLILMLLLIKIDVLCIIILSSEIIEIFNIQSIKISDTSHTIKKLFHLNGLNVNNNNDFPSETFILSTSYLLRALLHLVFILIGPYAQLVRQGQLPGSEKKIQN